MANDTSVKGHSTIFKNLQLNRFAYIQTGDPISLRSGCNSEIRPQGSLFHIKFVFNSEKDRRLTTGNRFKEAQPVRMLSTFQDGKLGHGQVFTEKRRLYGFYRPTSGFLSRTLGRIPKTVFCFRFFRPTILLHMFAFRLNNQSKGFYQSPKTSDQVSEVQKNKSDSLPRRSSNYGNDKRGNLETDTMVNHMSEQS